MDRPDQDIADCERWQRDETLAALEDLNKGRYVSHEAVSAWLRSWGQPDERNPRDDHRCAVIRLGCG